MCARKVKKNDAQDKACKSQGGPAPENPELCLIPPSVQDWENIFNSMTDMVTIHDDDWNIICANKAAQKILGLPEISVPKVKCFTYYHGTGCPPEGCPSCQSYKTGKPAEFETFEPHLNMFIEIRAIPRLDSTGNVIGLIHIVRDITQRKKIEEELRLHRNHLEELVKERTNKLTREVAERKRAEKLLSENEKRLSKSQEIAHLGSWELDLVNNVLTWSDEVYRIFGMKPRQFGATYEAFIEAVHPDDRAAVDEAYSDSVKEGRDTYEIEHRVLQKPSGEIRYVHEKCEHVRDETGRIIRSVGMVHDITERKRAEEEREKLINDLQKALSKIKTLKGLIPICAWCKKIRDDKGYWKRLETYISEHSEADFTHGICPDCQEKLKLEEEDDL